MKKREVPKKNYIILSIIIIITLFLTFLLRNNYIANMNASRGRTLMSKSLVVLNKEEFENYVLENTNSIIYVASSMDDSINDFELEFKDLIKKIGIENQIVYLDLEKVSVKELNELKNKYFSENLKDFIFSKYTNLLIMENGKVVSVLYNEKQEIKIEDVKSLLSSRGMIGQA